MPDAFDNLHQYDDVMSLVESTRNRTPTPRADTFSDFFYECARRLCMRTACCCGDRPILRIRLTPLPSSSSPPCRASTMLDIIWSALFEQVCFAWAVCCGSAWDPRATNGFLRLRALLTDCGCHNPSPTPPIVVADPIGGRVLGCPTTAYQGNYRLGRTVAGAW